MTAAKYVFGASLQLQNSPLFYYCYRRQERKMPLAALRSSLSSSAIRFHHQVVVLHHPSRSSSCKTSCSVHRFFHHTSLLESTLLLSLSTKATTSNNNTNIMKFRSTTLSLLALSIPATSAFAPNSVAVVSAARPIAFTSSNKALFSAVASYSTSEIGESATESFRLQFKEESSGSVISPWHDIPLMGEGGGYNMVVEIPKMTKAKMEVATKEESNPIAQDIKKGKLRDYHGPIFWNYGAFLFVISHVMCMYTCTAYNMLWLDPKDGCCVRRVLSGRQSHVPGAPSTVLLLLFLPASHPVLLLPCSIYCYYYYYRLLATNVGGSQRGAPRAQVLW